MIKIKEPAVVNMFYTGDSDKLKSQLEEFKNNSNNYEYKTRAVIVPHAGLFYSGQLAYQGINQLDKNIKNIFIFAPAHKVSFEGIALSTYDEWKTPLGNVKINQEINRELLDYGAKYFDEGYNGEHSVEIEIPVIQNIFDDVNVIPLLVGDESPSLITKIISKYYPDKNNGFIISSDLSHFLTDEKAKKIDLKTADMVEEGNLQGFSYNQACGAVGIYGLVDFANKSNYSLIRIDMYNSSKSSGDKNRVVGYGSWMLYEGSKNQFLKEYYSSYMINLAKSAILSRFEGDEVIAYHDCVFDQTGACFVTLKKQGRLRGCIGSIIAHQPLIVDLIKHAKDAAFFDSRFNPLEKEEMDELEIDISLLSHPKPIKFTDEKDLLDKIVPYKDGIIIKDGRYQAVYLPSVWEEIPEKEMFLKSLKIKAGLHPEHFSKTFEAYRFETEYIK